MDIALRTADVDLLWNLLIAQSVFFLIACAVSMFITIEISNFVHFLYFKNMSKGMVIFAVQAILGIGLGVWLIYIIAQFHDLIEFIS